MPTREDIFQILQEKVIDPELMMNIVDLGLVYDVEISAEAVADVTMTLTSPGCPVGPQIIKAVQESAATAYPDLKQVNVHLVWTPFWNPDMMSDEAKDELGIY